MCRVDYKNRKSVFVMIVFKFCCSFTAVCFVIKLASRSEVFQLAWPPDHIVRSERVWLGQQESVLGIDWLDPSPVPTWS